MAHIVPHDLEMLGLSLLSAGAPPETLLGLLDRVDCTYCALQSGRAAGVSGALPGENPYSCHALRGTWERGRVQGAARLHAEGIITVVVH